MAKEIVGQIKLQIPAGQANPAPPVGPALGQQGVNIMAFCKEFNAATKNAAGMVIPVVIAIAQSADIPPVAPALGACLGASLGFALPVSTPPNAIVYGTGFVPIKSMLRTGLLYDLLGAILIWLTLRLLCPLVGFV